MSNPMWETFVAGLVDEYAHRFDGDRVIWRVTKPDRDITCREREIRTVEGYVGLELRVERNGQVFRTEVHKGSRSLEKSRALLEAEGWTLTE